MNQKLNSEKNFKVQPDKEVILCVDDEPNIVDLLKKLLAREYSSSWIVTARSGEKALEKIESLLSNGYNITVAIVDEVMPKMTGTTVMYKLKGLTPHTKTVLLTGQAELEDVAKAINMGCIDQFMTKPWEPQSLILTLNNLRKLYVNDVNDEQYFELLEAKVNERTSELKNANFKLREMDRLKSLFFTGISYEFRTPLTLLLGPLENIFSGKFGPVNNYLKSQLKLVYDNSQKLARLINQLLDFAEIDSGGVVLKLMETDFSKFLSRIMEQFKTYANLKKIKLSLKEDFDLEKVFIDREKIDKVIANLLSNAFKFTPENGSIFIELSKEDNNIVVSITDTGKGIPEISQKIIFDRFKNVDGKSANSLEGTGLGLALVSDFVKMHEGNISLNSVMDKGSTFIIKIPVNLNEIKPDCVIHGQGKDIDEELLIKQIQQEFTVLTSNLNLFKKPVQTCSEDSSGSLKKEVILIVDDTVDMICYLTELLKDKYIIEVASNGSEGLEVALKVNPSIIISDVLMPKMDGYEFCKRIKESNELNHIPIILLTVRISGHNKILGLQCGADDYLNKPFNSEELIARIENLLIIRKQAFKLKEQNKQLEEAKDRLVRAEKLSSLGVLTAGICHEINNPNNYILVNSIMILDEYESIKNTFLSTLNDRSKQEMQEKFNDIKRGITSIKSGSSRIKKVVDSLSALSHTHNIQRKWTKLNPIIQGALSFVNTICNKDYILNWRRHKVSDIFCDGYSLNHAMVQVLLNAVQALNDKKGIIEIKTSENNNIIKIDITDNGMGIDNDNLNKIFDPFFTTKQVGEGLGLGLSLAHGIIEGHDGTIDIISKVNKGTTVTIQIPIK